MKSGLIFIPSPQTLVGADGGRGGGFEYVIFFNITYLFKNINLKISMLIVFTKKILHIIWI